MAEWSIAAVLKTVEGHTSGGSNPSLSAIKPDYQAFVVYMPGFAPKTANPGVFLYLLYCALHPISHNIFSNFAREDENARRIFHTRQRGQAT